MYSVVMMMALSGSAEAPECGRLLRCGCTGGYVCSGCTGTYYGCSGYSGCSGYVGCSGCSGGHGWFGRSWGYGCSGCYGGYGAYGTCAGCFGSYGTYAPIVMPPAAPPIVQPVPPPGASQSLPLPSQVRTPATIQVNIPTEAVIYFDGFRTTASGNRSYTTPALEQGKTYFYNVKVEMNQNGQTVATTQRVIVRAGDQAQVSVNFTPSGNLTARQN